MSARAQNDAGGLLPVSFFADTTFGVGDKERKHLVSGSGPSLRLFPVSLWTYGDGLRDNGILETKVFHEMSHTIRGAVGIDAFKEFLLWTDHMLIRIPFVDRQSAKPDRNMYVNLKYRILSVAVVTATSVCVFYENGYIQEIELLALRSDSQIMFKSLHSKILEFSEGIPTAVHADGEHLFVCTSVGDIYEIDSNWSMHSVIDPGYPRLTISQVIFIGGRHLVVRYADQSVAFLDSRGGITHISGNYTAIEMVYGKFLIAGRDCGGFDVYTLNVINLACVRILRYVCTDDSAINAVKFISSTDKRDVLMFGQRSGYQWMLRFNDTYRNALQKSRQLLQMTADAKKEMRHVGAIALREKKTLVLDNRDNKVYHVSECFSSDSARVKIYDGISEMRCHGDWHGRRHVVFRGVSNYYIETRVNDVMKTSPIQFETTFSGTCFGTARAVFPLGTEYVVVQTDKGTFLVGLDHDKTAHTCSKLFEVNLEFKVGIAVPLITAAIGIGAESFESPDLLSTCTKMMAAQKWKQHYRIILGMENGDIYEASFNPNCLEEVKSSPIRCALQRVSRQTHGSRIVGLELLARETVALLTESGLFIQLALPMFRQKTSVSVKKNTTKVSIANDTAEYIKNLTVVSNRDYSSNIGQGVKLVVICDEFTYAIGRKGSTVHVWLVNFEAEALCVELAHPEAPWAFSVDPNDFSATLKHIVEDDLVTEIRPFPRSTSLTPGLAAGSRVTCASLLQPPPPVNMNHRTKNDAKRIIQRKCIRAEMDLYEGCMITGHESGAVCVVNLLSDIIKSKEMCRLPGPIVAVDTNENEKGAVIAVASADYVIEVFTSEQLYTGLITPRARYHDSESAKVRHIMLTTAESLVGERQLEQMLVVACEDGTVDFLSMVSICTKVPLVPLLSSTEMLSNDVRLQRVERVKRCVDLISLVSVPCTLPDAMDSFVSFAVASRDGSVGRMTAIANNNNHRCSEFSPSTDKIVLPAGTSVMRTTMLVTPLSIHLFVAAVAEEDGSTMMFAYCDRRKRHIFANIDRCHDAPIVDIAISTVVVGKHSFVLLITLDVDGLAIVRRFRIHSHSMFPDPAVLELRSAVEGASRLIVLADRLKVIVAGYGFQIFKLLALWK